MLPWWPKEATLNLASEETPTLAGSSRCRWRNHLVMSGDIISLKVAASVGISKLAFANIEKAAKHYAVDLSETSWHDLGAHPQRHRKEAAAKGVATKRERGNRDK